METKTPEQQFTDFIEDKKEHIDYMPYPQFLRYKDGWLACHKMMEEKRKNEKENDEREEILSLSKDNHVMREELKELESKLREAEGVIKEIERTKLLHTYSPKKMDAIKKLLEYKPYFKEEGK